MTRDEQRLRVKALEILVLVGGHGDPGALEALAKWLDDYRREVSESAARACLYISKEWREPVNQPEDINDHVMSLRNRSAETSDLCAYRIAPWLRKVTTGGST